MADPTPIDVALSFASEQRHYVDTVYRCLADAGVSVFYDDNEKANLWGTAGPERFEKVYGTEAFRVVMFISKEYVEKHWTTTERQAAMSRLLDDPASQHILPVRFDDTPVADLDQKAVFVRADTTNPVDLASLILRHLVEVGRIDPAVLEHEGYRTAQARLVSFSSMVGAAKDGRWPVEYRVQNGSEAAIDAVVVAFIDPGAEDRRPEDQAGCALELVVGVLGPGQLKEGTDEARLTADTSFGELPYLGYLLWTDVDDNHWMLNGANLTRRAYRARTC